jgi:cystathionine beta-lyase
LGFQFDRIIDRTGTSSSKWEKYAGRDILPFWVADMDFATPELIRAAVAERLGHEVLGYTRTPPSLVAAFIGWLARSYAWTVPEEWLVWIPGVVPGVNLTARAVAEPGGAIVVPVPVYYPFLSVARNAGQTELRVPLVRQGRRWVMDFTALQDAVDAFDGGRARLLLLSNPQNPTGRAYTRAELTALADFCFANDLTLCSDEIHSAIIIDPEARHVPIASLDPEIARRTVSLFAATKTYNMPGLSCAVAVIPDPELRRAFIRAQAGLVPGIGPLALAASEAAFADDTDYLPALLDYLRENHRRLAEVAGERMTPVEATYLGWIDLTDTPVAARAGAHFEAHGLGLSDGGPFGGPGYVRFNFACPRVLLDRGLERLAAGLDALNGH